MPGTASGKILSIVGTLAVAYALLLLLLYLVQARLLYFPNMPGRALTATPADIGLAYETVTPTTRDGIRLSGWFVPTAETPVAFVLFLHGNAGNIAHRLDSLKIFHELGLATLIVDYRGFGASEGDPTEQGTYLDAEAAWSHLVDHRGIEPERIIVFGRSLGAAVAARLAADRHPRALILESAFRSIPALAAELYPLLPARWLARFRYDTEAYVRAVRCPVLVVHSRDDEITPIEHGRHVFAAANHPKRFLALRGTHNDAFLIDRERYVEGLSRFLARHLSSRPSRE